MWGCGGGCETILWYQTYGGCNNIVMMCSGAVVQWCRRVSRCGVIAVPIVAVTFDDVVVVVV